MCLDVGILHVIINGHGSNANMNKRSQFSVLDLNVLGTVAVPYLAPSKPQMIGSFGYIFGQIIWHVAKRCISQVGHRFLDV